MYSVDQFAYIVPREPFELGAGHSMPRLLEHEKAQVASERVIRFHAQERGSPLRIMLFAVRSRYERRVASHLRLERVFHDGPQIAVLLLGDRAERLDDFKRNPQQFIELATESINRTKRLTLVDGIRYQRIGEDDYYAQELFEQEELTGYLKNMLAATKSVYESGVYDSSGVDAHLPNNWRRMKP